MDVDTLGSNNKQSTEIVKIIIDAYSAVRWQNQWLQWGGGLSPCCNCATTLIIKPSLPNAGPMLLNAFKNDITCILSVYNSNASIKVS